MSRRLLRALVEAVRIARVPAMAGVTATVLDDSAMPTYLLAVEALSEYLLSTPDVLAAVEAVETLGAKRAAYEATGAHTHEGDEDCAVCDAFGESKRAAMALYAIADRLAARKGE